MRVALLWAEIMGRTARSVAVLRMRNGTSLSPFRLALGDNPGAPVRPAPGHGSVTTCPQGGGRTSPWPSVERLDGVSDALASGLYGCGTPPHRPDARAYAYRGPPAFASLSMAGSRRNAVPGDPWTPPACRFDGCRARRQGSGI